MSGKVVLQLSGLLGDMMLVGFGAATLLYALWLLFKARGLVNLGRLSLVVAFGAAVITLALGQGYVHGFSYPLFFLFLFLALFLAMEFLFQMSVLGLLVSAVGLILTSTRYWQLPPVPSPAAANAAVAYWWVLRDLAFTTGAAVLALSLGALVLLVITCDHRPSDVVHPNDLRDVSALLARGTVPLFGFAAFAAGVALWRGAGLPPLEIWRFGWLVVLTLASIGILIAASQRKPASVKTLALALIALVCMLAYTLGPLLLPLLTGTGMTP